MKKGKRKAKLQQQPQPELKEASRAQLGEDEERRPYRPRARRSVEDPLEDWPKEE